MSRVEKEELIRWRAYAIWVEEGQPEGREHEHWERARRDVQQDAGFDTQPSTRELLAFEKTEPKVSHDLKSGAGAASNPRGAKAKRTSAA